MSLLGDYDTNSQTLAGVNSSYFNTIYDTGDLTVSGTSNLNSLTVSGTSNLQSVTANGDIQSSNDVYLNENLNVGEHGLFGGQLSIGDRATFAKNVNCIGDMHIYGNLKYKYQVGAILNIISQFSVPIYKNIENTTQVYTNLNLQTYLNTYQSNIILFPTYNIYFYSNYTLLLKILNKDGTDLLFQNVNLQSLNCTNIILVSF